MTAWIKLWNEMLHDPKILSLTDEQYRFWVTAMQMAGVLERKGEIGKPEEIALVVRKSVGRTRQLLVFFQKQAMMSPAGKGWKIVNFVKRQGKPSEQPSALRERQRRSREMKRLAECHTEKGVTGGRDKGVTDKVSRPRHAQEEKRREEIKSLRTTTTAAKAASQPPVDNPELSALQSRLLAICQLDLQDPRNVEKAASFAEAIADNLPEVNISALDSLFSVNGKYHKTFYPELSQPLPPKLDTILQTLDQLLG